MAETQFAKSFLALLDKKAIKLNSDYVSDPKRYPSQSPVRSMTTILWAPLMFLLVYTPQTIDPISETIPQSCRQQIIHGRCYAQAHQVAIGFHHPSRPRW